MEERGRRWIMSGGIIAGLIVLSWLIMWLWVLAAGDPFNQWLFRRLPWPIACTAKGCLTSRDWQRGYQAQAMFAASLNESPPHPNEVLTTVIRHQLVKHALLGTPLTIADARKYRQEILRLEDEQMVRERSGLSLAEYDEIVLVPLLRQEALRQQHKIEDYNELFKMLARERRVVVLPRGLIWNRDEARVVSK